MKARQQRTHLMGSSNRDQNIVQLNNQFKSQTIFERSFNKSKSLVPKLSSSLPPQNKQKRQNTRKNPFSGFHNEFETERFDKNNIKPYKQQKLITPQQKPGLSLISHLNHDIKTIQQQFKGKRINLKKIQQLKNAFITNNKNRRDLSTNFAKFAKNGIIDRNGLKQIVKQYGYDINEDQIKLIFKLTHYSNHSEKYQDYLKIDGFVQLMTKDNIFFKTLELNHKNTDNLGQITFGKNFSDKVHLVLRNKFHNLKEAFNIYTKRNQDIGLKQFNYVMKKLDITDLVLTKKERDHIFKMYSSEKEKLNVQGLLCAIIEQEHNTFTNSAPYTSPFMGDLKVNQQQNFAKQHKYRNFSFKNLSTIEYEAQYKKARAVIEQLTILREKKNKNKQDVNIYKNIFENNIINHQQVIASTEKILKNQGINFSKEDYQAFAAYLNYDSKGQITSTRIDQLVFDQPQKIARDRFQRRLRQQAPEGQKQMVTQVDQISANRAIEKLKQLKMHPQARQFFKFFDKDKDGFISKQEFTEKILQLNLLQNWEIQNLANHFNLHKEGSINFQDFAKKISNNIEMLINTNSLQKSGNWSQATKLKKTFIKQSNQPTYQHPTRHSAWPTNLFIQDLSLLQPQQNSGMYQSEIQRFGERKEDFGRNQKLEQMIKSENRVKRLAEWNNILQQRLERQRDKQQRKEAEKTYQSKLALEKYQFDCHQ